MYTPYDWNQTVQQKSDYIEDRLRDGSPVVGLSCAEGVVLLTVKRAQRKVFEIYDRLMFAALGNQSDIETIRMGAIDVAHTEGYTRSPEDVTAHRVVGFAVSPPIKRAFADPFTAPFVVRAIFAELGASPADDRFFTLDYNGEYASVSDYAVVAGTTEGEAEALEWLTSRWGSQPLSLEQAVPIGLRAWAGARRRILDRDRKDSEDADDESQASPRDLTAVLHDELEGGEIEVGLLDRRTNRERRFRLAGNDEAESFLRAALSD